VLFDIRWNAMENLKTALAMHSDDVRFVPLVMRRLFLYESDADLTNTCSFFLARGTKDCLNAFLRITSVKLFALILIIEIFKMFAVDIHYTVKDVYIIKSSVHTL
jgi:hypothetical protein